MTPLRLLVLVAVCLLIMAEYRAMVELTDPVETRWFSEDK